MQESHNQRTSYWKGSVFVQCIPSPLIKISLTFSRFNSFFSTENFYASSQQFGKFRTLRIQLPFWRVILINSSWSEVIIVTLFSCAIQGKRDVAIHKANNLLFPQWVERLKCKNCILPSWTRMSKWYFYITELYDGRKVGIIFQWW